MRIKHIFSSTPVYIIFLAFYPVLAYLAWNIREVDIRLVYRPLLISLLFSGAIFGLTRWAIKDWHKAGFLTALIQFVFFTYGHIKNGLDALTWPATKNIWHIVLALISTALLVIVGHIIRKTRRPALATQILNAVGLVLLIGPLTTLLTRPLVTGPQTAVENPLPTADHGAYPDIYYIILDGYSRQDTLQSLGYDNRDFRSKLEEMGFYIATCSRSNYRNTLLSLSSSLNMNYIWRVVPNQGVADKNLQPVYTALLDNRVRRELKRLGYTVIAFETGFEWDEWRDADIYIKMHDNPFTAPWLQPFEYGLMQTTALNPLLESGLFAKERFVAHYRRVLFTFEQLPLVATLPGPKFVFVHVIVPHAPFMFLPDGSINPDTRYYRSAAGVGSTRELEIQGYLNNVQFVDTHFPQVLQSILANSAQPPVIVVQGDHGLVAEAQKYNILNAYYLPGDGKQVLYPTITPVNTFRVIFNQYLGGNYDLLRDMSIDADRGNPFWKKNVRPYPANCP